MRWCAAAGEVGLSVRGGFAYVGKDFTVDIAVPAEIWTKYALRRVLSAALWQLAQRLAPPPRCASPAVGPCEEDSLGRAAWAALCRNDWIGLYYTHTDLPDNKPYTYRWVSPKKLKVWWGVRACGS